MTKKKQRNHGKFRRNKKIIYQRALTSHRVQTNSREPESSKQKLNDKDIGTRASSRRKYLKYKVGAIPKILIFPFKKKNLLTTVALIICMTSFLTFLYLMKSTPTEIRAELTGLGDIEFTYSGKQSSAISPLCGCYSELPREAWRGITFPARYLQINREGSKPLTGYMMTAAEPDNINWRSSTFQLQGTIYTFALPETDNFDPRVLLNDEFPQTYRVLNTKKYDNAHYFMIVSQQGLNIALLGDTPLGSWIPTDESKVVIKYQREGMHLNAPNVAVIEEKYKNTEANVETVTVPNVPLGDFLGPNVIFWSEDKLAVIIARDDILQLNQSLQKGEKVIQAIVTQPSFSVRLGVDPMEKELVDSYLEDLRNYNSLPNQERRKGSSVKTMVVGQLDDGQVTVSITNPEKQSEEFDVVYNRMKENDVVDRRIEIDADMDGKPYKKSLIMNFRYPPIPPNRGFNIFGPISSIKFSRAVGSLALGSRNVDIKVPSMLDFREIQSLDIEKGVFTVPIQLNTAEEKAKIQLKATSQTYLNDEPLNRRIDEYKMSNIQLPLISATVSILSLLVGLWSRIRK